MIMQILNDLLGAPPVGCESIYYAAGSVLLILVFSYSVKLLEILLVFKKGVK